MIVLKMDDATAFIAYMYVRPSKILYSSWASITSMSMRTVFPPSSMGTFWKIPSGEDDLSS
jgi:hypothetical protein